MKCTIPLLLTAACASPPDLSSVEGFAMSFEAAHAELVFVTETCGSPQPPQGESFDFYDLNLAHPLTSDDDPCFWSDPVPYCYLDCPICGPGRTCPPCQQICPHVLQCDLSVSDRIGVDVVAIDFRLYTASHAVGVLTGSGFIGCVGAYNATITVLD